MISYNIVGYCFRETALPGVDSFDIGEFFKRIFLFDTVYLHSVRLNEIKHIIRYIGVENLLLLLKERAIQFIIDPVFVTSVGQKPAILKRCQENVLPLGSYSFASLSLPRNKVQLSEMLSKILPDGYTISKRKYQKLKLAIIDNIRNSPENVVYGINACMNQDLKNNNPVIAYFIHRQLLDKALPDDRFHEFEIQTNQIAENDFKISTNLGALYNLTLEEEHDLVEGSVRALGNFNIRILEMASYDAVSCFKDEDLTAFEPRLRYLLAKTKDANIQEPLNRVVEVIGLPNFSDVGRLHDINIPKLIKVKQSGDYSEFRNFLYKHCHQSNDELTKYMKSFGVRLATFTNSPLTGRIRLLANLGTGLLNPFYGISATILDNYLFNKLLPKNGVISVIKRDYPSLFTNRDDI